MEKPSPDRHPTKKRIAIIRNAYRYDFGGGERMPVELAAELAKHGYNPLIISRSPKLLEYSKVKNLATRQGLWWSRQNWSGYRIVLTPIYFIWQVVLYFWYLFIFLRFRPSIVHTQSKDDFIAATLAGRSVGAKIIWSDHADLKYVFQNVSVWYKNPIGKLVKLCSKLASNIILTSQNDKKMIERALGVQVGRKYLVIYNGIVDHPDLLNKLHAGEEIVFAATSRLVTDKGIGELITAFMAVSSKYPTSELWLFGEGPEENRFKNLAKDEPKIHFKGFPADSLDQVAKADIFVHPSYMEGFSLSLVEAAMLAKPIIACSVGGNLEIIQNGKNGLLVPPRDSKELANAMDRLASNPGLRNHLGKQARITYEDNFVFNNIVTEKYLPLYER